MSRMVGGENMVNSKDKSIVMILKNDTRTVLGTGFYAGNSKNIITCHHVVSDYVVGGSVLLSREKQTPFYGTLTKIDIINDLALIQVDEDPSVEPFNNYYEIITSDLNRRALIKGYDNALTFAGQEELGIQCSVKIIGLRKPHIQLSDANSVCKGFSGAPLYDKGILLGVIRWFPDNEKHAGRREDDAYAIPAGKVAELIGDSSLARVMELDKLVKWAPENDFASYLSNLPEQRQERRDTYGKFCYDSHNTVFVGRDKEMKLLQGFVVDERPLLWWAITGPGGVGKSRLAYEFVNELNAKHNNEWIARFLPWKSFSQQFYNQSLYPKLRNKDTNLFIVIDYIFAYEKEIAEWVQWLHDQKLAEKDGFKIRILLIEREQQKVTRDGKKLIAPLWENALGSGFSSSGAFHSTLYMNTFIQVSSTLMRNVDWMNIIASYAKSINKKLNHDDVFRILFYGKKYVGEQLTPLIIQVLTEAYNPLKHALLVEDIETVLQNAAEREVFQYMALLHLEPGMKKVLHNILFIATILSDINLDKEEGLISRYLTKYDRKKVGTVLEVLNDSELVWKEYDNTIHIKGLQPDIIGEAFVLSRLLELTVAESSVILEDLKDNYPQETMRFLIRLKNDFAQKLEENDCLDVVNSLLPGEQSIILIDDHNQDVICDILFTFDSDKTGKSYIVYTDSTRDEEGNTKVYASIYDPSGINNRLFPIETEQEWDQISIVLDTIQEEISNSDSLEGKEDMDQSDIEARIIEKINKHIQGDGLEKQIIESKSDDE